jgi:aminoglycoside phosphotransferase family enzyme/predicted kinase
MDHVVASQEPVFALLGNPATYGGHSVKRVDTHAAVLFLTHDHVYKVKRAVRFPFLDYSTLEKRKAACEAEIEVNRPYAPDLYLRVVPITQDMNGQLSLDGRGVPVDWAVQMRRFNESQTLDHLADERKIDAVLADALGRVVAAAHKEAPPVDPAPWIGAIRSYIEEHVTAFGESPKVFPSAEVEALAEASRAAYVRIRPLLVERAKRGLIRHIHGDLHLGNIVLILGRPVLFDAIEFSPIIASGDVLYDLAFLLMDLCERRLGGAANVVFNRYFAQTRRDIDLDALAALPYYLSMRAAIRAKVTAARLEQAADDDRPYIARQARTYFDWANRFIAPAPPTLVAVGGLSGTGKTALASALAADCPPAPGALVLRSDVERKAFFGKNEDETLPEEAYTPEMTARIYCLIADKARRALAAGQSVVLDAMFARPGERTAARRSAEVLGVRFQGLFLQAPLDTRLARIAKRREEDDDASDADVVVARRQEQYDLGALDWARVDASGTPEDTLARARRAVGA